MGRLIVLSFASNMEEFQALSLPSTTYNLIMQIRETNE